MWYKYESRTSVFTYVTTQTRMLYSLYHRVQILLKGSYLLPFAHEVLNDLMKLATSSTRACSVCLYFLRTNKLLLIANPILSPRTRFIKQDIVTNSSNWPTFAFLRTVFAHSTFRASCISKTTATRSWQYNDFFYLLYNTNTFRLITV